MCRVISDYTPEKVTVKLKLKDEESAMCRSEKGFPCRGTAKAKALRWENA